MLKIFKKKAPREYSKKLIKTFGYPTAIGKYFLEWERPLKNYDSIRIQDEYIAHDFPTKHHDFVYSTSKFSKLTATNACALIKVSGSIIPDLLKKTVTARCGGLTANDITLSFVNDVVNGKVKATKKEYSKRIKNKIITMPKKYNSHFLMLL